MDLRGQALFCIDPKIPFYFLAEEGSLTRGALTAFRSFDEALKLLPVDPKFSFLGPTLSLLRAFAPKSFSDSFLAF